MTAPAEHEVLAAGGVVLRRTAKGSWRVLLVHRPTRADWSLPKGKLDPGESFEAAAVREVEEETGVSCRLLEELPSVSYEDGQGRDKLVRYWRMEARAGDPADRRPDGEVDAARWVLVEEASELLTYDDDRHLLDHALRSVAS